MPGGEPASGGGGEPPSGEGGDFGDDFEEHAVRARSTRMRRIMIATPRDRSRAEAGLVLGDPFFFMSYCSLGRAPLETLFAQRPSLLRQQV
jgi:hypothetical protein